MANYLSPIFLTDIEPLPIIIIVASAVVVLVLLVLLIIFLKKRKKHNSSNTDEWFIALGGKENTKEISAVGSRLSLILVDKEKIDREKIKDLGVSSVLSMANKTILVIENQADKIANLLNNNL